MFQTIDAELVVSYSYAGSRLCGSPKLWMISVSGFLTAWPWATPLNPASATTSVNTSNISNRRLKLILQSSFCHSAALPSQGSPTITPLASIALRGRLLEHGRLGPNERDCHVLLIRKACRSRSFGPCCLSEYRRLAPLMLERQNRAGHEVTVAPVIHQLRVVHPAAVLRVQAARVEPAPRRRVDRAGYVPGQDDTLPPQPGMWDGHRREQCFGIRVLRIGEQLVRHRDLDDPS